MRPLEISPSAIPTYAYMIDLPLTIAFSPYIPVANLLLRLTSIPITYHVGKPMSIANRYLRKRLPFVKKHHQIPPGNILLLTYVFKHAAFCHPYAKQQQCDSQSTTDLVT